jgi:hypothetical protein
MAIREIDTLVFLEMQINRTDKLSIKLGWFQILQFLCCCNIHSHNAMFHHSLLNFAKADVRKNQ